MFLLDSLNITPMPFHFDPLTATVSDLQAGLQEGKFDSVYLVNTYLAQIQKHNDYLHAVLSVAPLPLLLEQAEALDAERVSGKSRGPLHGIPILVKVSLFELFMRFSPFFSMYGLRRDEMQVPPISKFRKTERLFVIEASRERPLKKKI